MSRKLRELINQEFIKGNRPKLIEATGGKSERTLLRWIEKGFPRAHDAYQLALACGCTADEAMRLAKQECPVEAKETA